MFFFGVIRTVCHLNNSVWFKSLGHRGFTDSSVNRLSATQNTTWSLSHGAMDALSRNEYREKKPISLLHLSQFLLDKIDEISCKSLYFEETKTYFSPAGVKWYCFRKWFGGEQPTSHYLSPGEVSCFTHLSTRVMIKLHTNTIVTYI